MFSNFLLTFLIIAFFITVFILAFISRRSQKVMESLLTILTKPERVKVQDASRILQTLLSDEVNKIHDNFKNMQETLNKQILKSESLKNILETKNNEIVNTTEEAVKKVSVMTTRLENTIIGLTNIVNSADWVALSNSSDRFIENINTMLDRTDTVSENITNKTDALISSINTLSSNGKTLDTQLQENTNKNIERLNELKNLSNETYESISKLSNSLESNFEKIKNSSLEQEKILINNNDYATSYLERIQNFTKESQKLLTSQVNTLTTTSNAVGAQIRLAEVSIEKSNEKINYSSDMFIKVASNTEDLVKNISKELTVLTNTYTGNVKDFSNSVSMELKAVAGDANITLENTKVAAATFSGTVKTMANGVREVLTEMNTAYDQLSNQSNNLIKISNDTLDKLKPLSEIIENYYSALPNLSSGSVEMANKLEEIIKSMNSEIDILKNTVLDSVSQISNSTSELSLLSGKSRQQMIDLMADYTKAVDSMQSLNKQMMIAKATAPMEAIKAPTPIKYPRISSQDFMSQSEKQLSNLHDQIFEITNITGATLPDNLLAKYHAGDKTVFSKWFAKMITVADKKQIKNLLKTDTIFKSLSIKYVHSFARLISSAEISDNKEMIVSTLLKSDLGQIYTALKEFI